MGTLRFLLALAVAGGHAAAYFGFAGEWILTGSRAVQIFYIISGFLMAMILNGKYADTRGGNWIFYSNRILKIFPPYFVVLGLTAAVCLLSKAANGDALLLEPWFQKAGTFTFSTWVFALLTNIFIVGQEWAFLLVFRSGDLFYSLQAMYGPELASQFTVMTPAWTISIELMFYAIAPFVLRRRFLLIAALAGASQLFRFEAYHLGYYTEATDYRFFPFELSLFLYGAICFRAGRFLIPRNAAWSAAITAAVITTVALLPKYLLEHQYQLYAMVGIALPAMFDFSRRNLWDRSLGDLSYPLYLAHWPVVDFSARLFKSGAETSPFFPALAVAASIGAAGVINRFIVKPIDRRRQSRIKAAPAVVRGARGFASAP